MMTRLKGPVISRSIFSLFFCLFLCLGDLKLCVCHSLGVDMRDTFYVTVCIHFVAHRILSGMSSCGYYLLKTEMPLLEMAFYTLLGIFTQQLNHLADNCY